MEHVVSVLYYALLALLAVLFIYALVRVGSFAYFRTKLEHFRRVRYEIERGGRDYDKEK